MDNALEYILKLQDQLSPAMVMAARTSETEANRIVQRINSITSSVEHAGEAAKSFKEKFSGFKELLGTVGIGIGFYKLEQMMEAGVEKAHELHTAEAALANTMKNMGTYSVEAFEDAIKSSSALYKNVMFGKAEIIDLQAQLRLVGNIGNDEMERMVKASADMATKFHMGLSEAGNAIAKAVNNPEMLRRLGMQLKIDPAIQKHLQELAKDGHEAQARLELLTIVEGKVGGAAKAAFDADPLGPYKKAIGAIQVSLGEAAIKIQKWLAPALEWLARAFKNVITYMGIAVDWIQQHKELILAAALAVGVYTVAVNWSAIVTGIATVATQGWAFIQGVLNAVMNANPIILIISLIIGLIAWIYQIVKANKNWGDSLKAIWEITKSVFSLMAIPVKAFWEALSYWFTKAWYTIEDWGERTWQFMKNLWSGIKTFFTDGWDAAKAEVGKTIHTEAEVKIAALEKEHGNSQKAYDNEFLGEIKNISDNYNKIDFSIQHKAKGVEPVGANSGAGIKGLGDSSDLGNTAKGKADSINGSGQRNITININKQIGAENIHVMGGTEAANNIESLVREAMRRMLLSLNGNAVN